MVSIAYYRASVGSVMRKTTYRKDSRNPTTLNHSTQTFFMTIQMSKCTAKRQKRVENVTTITRPRSKTVTLNATRPPDLGPFFVGFRLSLR